MILRPATEDDLVWVRDAWMKSFADSDWALFCTPRGDARTLRCDACSADHFARSYEAKDASAEYKSGQYRLMSVLLKLYGATVAESEGGLLDAFLVATPPSVIHYVYVRLSARGQGLARRIIRETLSGARLTYTHRSRGLVASRLPDAYRYDPYGIYWSLLP